MNFLMNGNKVDKNSIYISKLIRNYTSTVIRERLSRLCAQERPSAALRERGSTLILASTSLSRALI